MVKIATVSAMSEPSGTHMFGYTAAIAAAIRPARVPAIRRPVAPMSAIEPAPSAADQIM